MNVKVRYLRDSRELYGPSGLGRATPFSAGMDLRAAFAEGSVTIAPGDRLGIPSGIAVEPPAAEGCLMTGFVFSRSGLGAVKGLTVAQGVGVIDQDYRGEITVFLLNTSREPLTVARGDRIAQLVYISCAAPDVEEAQELEESARGAGGFGHTGSR